MKKERRLYPRLKTDFPIEITMPDGEIVTATTINLSTSGVQMECGRSEASQMFSVSEDEKTLGKPIELKTCLKLPIKPTAPTEICLLCRIVISRRLEENIYHIGLKYIDLKEDQQQTLETYLDQLLNSK